MRITKWIECATQVDIDLSIKDIHNIIDESDTTFGALMSRINDFLEFFKGIPDSRIAEMTDTQRVKIALFLKEQVKRFIE